MMRDLIRAGAREASLELVIHRADGRVENLGVVAYWHKNPLKRALFRIRRRFKELLK